MKTTLLLAASALLVTACSAPYGQHSAPYGHNTYGGQYGATQSYQYGDCGSSACAPGTGYSVAPKPHHAGYPAQTGPQTINAPHAAYGSAAAAPLAALHGTSQPRRGYTYGELGGVAYDPFDDTYGVQGRLGYQSASYWGVEAEGSLGLTDRTEVVTVAGPTGPVDVTVDAGVKHSLAGFGRLAYPVSPRVNLVSRVGYHTTTLEGEAGGVQSDIDIDGLAYGAGIEYVLSPRSAVRLDYTNYDGGDDAAGSLDTLAVGYQVRF